MSDRGSYTNYPHDSLGDETPGYDPDFSYPHLDPDELNDLKVEGEGTNNGSENTSPMSTTTTKQNYTGARKKQ